MKLLWLPSWYPNKTDPYAGDFIMRHAEAVALQQRVEVIYLLRDRVGDVTKRVLEEKAEKGGLTERIIYYHSPALSWPLADRLLSGLYYRRLYRGAVKAYLRREGLPAAAHVHVAGKNGWMALWLKRKYGVPFVVSEHWTGYLPGAKPGFDRLSSFARWLWRRVMRQAAGLSVVSRCLGDAIAALQSGVRFSVIPNVVDTRLFFPAASDRPGRAGLFHFIHISGLGYQKNPEAILRAFALVKQARLPFRLSVVGPKRIDLERLAAELGLGDDIGFIAEMPQRALADYLRQADALILYSRYETFGCVLIEANACGLPVIVSDIPVHHETIEEGVNGYFAEGENAAALAQKISRCIQQAHGGNKEAIAAGAREKYNYERIGKLFAGFYKDSLGMAD